MVFPHHLRLDLYNNNNKMTSLTILLSQWLHWVMNMQLQLHVVYVPALLLLMLVRVMALSALIVASGSSEAISSSSWTVSTSVLILVSLLDPELVPLALSTQLSLDTKYVLYSNASMSHILSNKGFCRWLHVGGSGDKTRLHADGVFLTSSKPFC